MRVVVKVRKNIHNNHLFFVWLSCELKFNLTQFEDSIEQFTVATFKSNACFVQENQAAPQINSHTVKSTFVIPHKPLKEKCQKLKS